MATHALLVTPSRHSPAGKPTAASAARASTSPMAPPPPQDTNVQVAVRCRPLNEREKAAGRNAIVQCKPNSNELAVMKRKTYAFDKVYGQYSTQKDVFRATVKPAVDEALAGYNCTVFAYGQTGTGKTYTMQGELSPDHEMAGIIPRSVRYIFDSLQAMQGEYSVKISFLQIYNEELKDLLEPHENKKLRLMEDAKRGGIYCQNLLEVTTTTAEHVFQLLETGVKNRITSETLMNENSSRSHSIFTIRIHCKENSAATAGDDLLRIGQLNLVDLAGSECVGRSGARNVRAREAGSINQSLLTLGRVITALVDNHPHIPYRDSKLTRLLQESLGGRAKTTIIATLAPCADSVDETMSTLEYAHRAKSIKNKPQVNQKMARSGLLREYGSEIEALRSALQAARQKDGIFLPPAQFAEMEERMAGQAAQILELEDELDARSKLSKELEETVETQREELLVLQAAKKDVETKLATTENELRALKDELHHTQNKLTNTQNQLHAFQENEKTLLANGAAAAKLFQESENRVHQLLAKIGRKQHVEDANMELTMSFTGESSTQIMQFQERLASHQKTQQQMFDDLVVAVTDLEVAHSHDLEKLAKNAKALGALLEDWNAQFVEEESKIKAFSDKAGEELSEIVGEHHKNMEAKLSKLTTMSKSHAESISAELINLKKRRHEILEQVKNLAAKSRAEMEVFLSEQSDKMLELQAAIEMSIDEQTKKLTENNGLLLEALKDSHTERQQQFDNLKNQLTEFFTTISETQAERLQEQTALVEQCKAAQENQLTKLQQMSEIEIKSSVESLGSFSTKHAGALDRIGQRMMSVIEEDNRANVDQESLIHSHAQELVSWKDTVAELNNSHQATLSNAQKRHQEQANRLTASKATTQLEFSDNHRKLERTMFAGCSTIGSTIQSRVETTKRKLSSVSNHSHKTIEESQADSAKRLDELEIFMKKRRLDAPTGATPTKQNYVFPMFEPTRIISEALNATNELLSKAATELTRSFSTTSNASTSSTSSVVDATTEKQADGEVGTSEKQPSNSQSELPGSEHSTPKKMRTPQKKAEVSLSRGSSAGARGMKTKSTAAPASKPRFGVKVVRPGASASEKVSALAMPKRFRAKAPLGESTNFR